MANKEKTNEMTFTKQQILTAKKYNDKRDLLTVLLIDDRSYALTEVDKLIDEFLKKKFDNPGKEAK